jgi:histidyl-tRNA synthetase
MTSNIAMKNQIQTLKGFRDFLPQEKKARDFVEKKLIETFERFGFEPLETPALEYAELLTGKYGNEADKLVYLFEDRGGRNVGLRYDQTVPTARVLSQYQNELPHFFRRYQIQNVFRADKPQKGRYREFVQADADIFNAQEPIADAEILAVFYAVFANVGLNEVSLLVNDRRTLLATVEPFANEMVNAASIIQSIDKLDKMSQEDVERELVTKGLPESAAMEVISTLKQIEMSESLKQIIDYALALGVPSQHIIYSPTLARGLDYYTGLIFEAVYPNVSGSLGAGGRYDNLIKDLGGPHIPAVGFGLGFDRIIEVLQSQKKLALSTSGSQVLITVFDNSTVAQSLVVASKLRQAGISVQVYPRVDKLPKQFKYADKQNIPYVAIIGSQEANDSSITIKNMESGEQQTIPQNEAVNFLLAA